MNLKGSVQTSCDRELYDPVCQLFHFLLCWFASMMGLGSFVLISGS
uniref:Uncharacterized protein n=1 Tax=Arundo donax TaxID=35708 RepID=A0A0A9B8T2_ARUDO